MDSLHNFEKPNITADMIPGRNDLVEFFDRKGIHQYLEIFPKTVNFAYFKTMDSDDFEDYGITNLEDMNILLNAVKQAVEEEEAEDAKNQSSNNDVRFFFFTFNVSTFLHSLFSNFF